MKNLLQRKWMLLMAILFANIGAWAQTWETVGTAGFSAGFIEYPSLAIDDGTPYISYKDGANSGKVTVKKLDGTSWVTVGTEGFTSNNIGKPCLAVSDGTPYVAYQGNQVLDGQKAMVKKFDGTSWVDAGSSSPSSGTVGMVNICIGNGTVYVVFEDYANGTKAVVKKLNGTTWESVGLTPSVGRADFPAIAVNNGTPYIAFKDYANGEKATVRKFNGTDWENVGTPGFSKGGLYWPALAFDNGTPYLAFVDYGNDGKVTVMKFNSTTWENVGTAGFSTNTANHPSLVINNGTPSLAYIDMFNDYISIPVFTLTVKKFNGTSWEDAGPAPVSPDDADYTSLATYNGALYVSYQDNGNDYKATVRKYGAPAVPMQLKFTTTDDDRGIDLPLFGTVNCTVDWGDGEPIETFTTEGTQWHTFVTAGTYTVSINGSLSHFGYYDDEDDEGWYGAGYLTEVVDFGSLGLTSLSGAFADADNLSSVPAALPATVTDLSYCFYLNGKASITNLNSWDVSHVTNMSAAFLEAPAFNQDISTWDVSGVTNMEYMFKRASAFNQNISIWDVSGVTNMEDMFRQASVFNQPIGIWDVSSVTMMEGMFQSASAFNQYINGWVVGSVTTMSSMFSGTDAFNQRISDWDVSTVTDMSWMFSGASAFDQSLTGWDINSVTTMEDMFKNVTLSTINYDSILTAWAAQPVQSNVVFNGGNSQYSAGAAATARGVLTGATNNWIITDGGQVFTVTTQAASAVAATTATGNGTIVSVGSGNATNRGVIYYPYSGTDKIIGDAGVTNVSENGDFSAAAFTASLTGLSVNARYNARAHATNTDDGTKYGARVDFWTTAKVPSAPGVINPKATSLDVVVNPNGNPAGVLFAIQDSANALYVQANGTRTATVVWQTAAQWDTTTVTDLSTGVTYYFRVKAKNDNNDATAFGLSTGQNTCSNPTNGGEIGSEQQVCTGTTPESLTSVSEASNYGGALEYKWQRSIESATTGFETITGATSWGYQPGTATQTTWYRRLARVGCKADWSGAAESNTVTVTVNAYVTPEVTIAQTSGTNPCCPPDFVTFTATPVNGGLNPTYEWFRNGVSVASTASHTFNPLDDDEVYVVMTTSLQCYTKEKDTSNTVTMQVTVPAVVSVSIRATRAPGGQVKFTAYPVNEGSAPVYTWYKNGVPIPGVAGPELISTCQTGDEHHVVLTSSLPCTTLATSGAMCTY